MGASIRASRRLRSDFAAAADRAACDQLALARFLLLAVLLHYSPSCDLLRPLAVTPGAFCRFLDVFVLPLFF